MKFIGDFSQEVGTKHDALVIACVTERERLMRQLLAQPPTVNLGPCFRCAYHSADIDNPEHVSKVWPAKQAKNEGGEVSNIFVCMHRGWIDNNKNAPCKCECWVDSSTGTVRNHYLIEYPYFLDSVIRCVLSRDVIFSSELEVRNMKRVVVGYADLLIKESITYGRIEKVTKRSNHMSREIEEQIINYYLIEAKPQLDDVGGGIRQLKHYKEYLGLRDFVGKEEDWPFIEKQVTTCSAIVTYKKPSSEVVSYVTNEGIDLVTYDGKQNKFIHN